MDKNNERMTTMTMTKQPLRELVERYDYLKVSPKDKIRDVAILMPNHHTSAAVVLDWKDNLIGIVTEQDIVEKAIAVKRNVDETHIEDIMTQNPVTISIDAPFTEALQLMTQNGFRTLPVMDGIRVSGIIDIRDLYDALNHLLEDEISIKDGLIAYSWGDEYGAGFRKAN
tara:strand:- start:950 stop:1459 length:510 start_codon:yes stop_codon:yes gene_type:complete